MSGLVTLNIILTILLDLVCHVILLEVDQNNLGGKMTILPIDLYILIVDKWTRFPTCILGWDITKTLR